MLRAVLLSVAFLVFAGCPSNMGQCRTSAECPTGQSCVANKCMGGAAGGTGGSSGTGGGTAGGSAAGGSTAGGSTAGGSTGGGSTMGGGAATGGESCAMAQVVSATSTMSGTTVGASNDVGLSCTGVRNPGPDRVYAVTVPPMQRLSVTLTPEETDPSDGGLQYDPSLYLVAGPAAACSPADAGDRSACLDGSDIDTPPGSPERVAYLNTTAAPVEVFVVVDSFFTMPDEMNGTTHEGRYDVSFTLAAPPMGDRCDSATTLTPGTLAGQTLTDFSSDYGVGMGCRRSDGPDRAYAISVPAGQRLSAVAQPDNDGGFDITVNVIAGPASSCEASPLVCLTGADSAGLGGSERVDYVNRGAAPQQVFLVVGSYDPTDTTTGFSLTTSVATPPPGDECSTAVTLTPGTPITGQDFMGFGGDYNGGPSCSFTTSGPDRVYALTVPPNKQATITATPSAGLNTSLSLIDGLANCATGMLRCVASASAGAGLPDVLVWTNRTTANQNLLVLVDSASPGTGTFDLSATIADPPMGDSCANATTLAAGAPIAGTTMGFTNDYTSSMSTTCASFDTFGNDRAYAFQVPNGQRAKVTVAPAMDGGFAASVSLVTGTAAACEASPRVCVAAANSSSGPRTAAFFNGTGAAVGTFAIVDGITGPGGDFTIGLSTATPPADDVCTTATTSLGTTPLMNQTLRPAGVTFERDYTCVSASRGVDRVYVASAPPNQRLSVTVTPTPQVMDGGFDPVLSLIAGPATACDSPARRCLAGEDVGGRNSPESASITNATNAAQPVFVVVSSYNDADSDTVFSLSSTTTTIAAGEVCENAQAITSGMPLMNETVASYAHDYAFSSLSCSRVSGGPDRVYSIQVGANQTLAVRGVPDMMSDIVLNVVEGPAANCNATSVTCLASADRGNAGQEDRLTWMNTTGAAKTVLIVVSNYRAGVMTYSLDVTVQ
ncbi:MAG: hypothetical protein JNJ54_08975 [Myxococcaceae bacterium]|nr:hypothetical protein [Myxococcaceae bacterium]